MEMTEEQAKRATAILARLLAREMGVEITKLTIVRVPQEADKDGAA